MNRLAILTYPDPRLRKKAAPISEITPELRELADDMLETMYAAPGIGLAATQVGVFQRIFVMDCASHDENPDPVAIINPEIIWKSDELVTHEEGCLSIPDHFEDVTRPAVVTVSYLDIDGVRHEKELSEVRSRCANTRSTI